MSGVSGSDRASRFTTEVSPITVPVLAAGAITSARAMAARAGGIRVGTRFVATQESGAHPDYVAALLAAPAEATVLTEAFSVGCPDAPHRVLSSAVAAAQTFPDEVVAMRQSASGSQSIARWLAYTPSREVTGYVEAMAMYAGQGVGQVTEVLLAAQVVTELAEGAQRLLRRSCGGAGTR